MAKRALLPPDRLLSCPKPKLATRSGPRIAQGSDRVGAYRSCSPLDGLRLTPVKHSEAQKLLSAVQPIVTQSDCNASIFGLVEQRAPVSGRFLPVCGRGSTSSSPRAQAFNTMAEAVDRRLFKSARVLNPSWVARFMNQVNTPTSGGPAPSLKIREGAGYSLLTLREQPSEPLSCSRYPRIGWLNNLRKKHWGVILKTRSLKTIHDL